MELRQLSFCCSVAVLPTSSAIAACQGQISGPVGKDSKYYYSSTCFKPSADRTIIKNKICSVSPSTIVFSWTKLNWVSGSSGVQFGDCLVKNGYYSDAIRIGGSKVSTNVSPGEVTDVYVPDLGKEGDKVYWSTVEGGGPRIEEGDREPFYFEIMYAPTNDKHSVHIRATMIGENPIFYIVLPSSIKTAEGLKTFVGNEYIGQLSSLVHFGEVLPRSKLSKNDTQLADFIAKNQISERGEIIVQADKVATVEFDALGDLKNILSTVPICVGQGESVATCYQDGTE